jgi:hypothetical protein
MGFYLWRQSNLSKVFMTYKIFEEASTCKLLAYEARKNAILGSVSIYKAPTMLYLLSLKIKFMRHTVLFHFADAFSSTDI